MGVAMSRGRGHHVRPQSGKGRAWSERGRGSSGAWLAVVGRVSHWGRGPCWGCGPRWGRGQDVRAWLARGSVQHQGGSKPELSASNSPWGASRRLLARPRAVTGHLESETLGLPG
jgi:hypothetical protein